MDFDLTSEQQALQTAAADFARRELRREVEQRDRASVFDRTAWDRCAAFGVAGLPIPAEYGGQGRSLTDALAVLEGLGQGAEDQGLLFSIGAHLWAVSMPILVHGSDDLKRRYLPRLVSGGAIGAGAATEPAAGSDVFSLQTRATRDGDSYVLEGTKTLITNAPVADVFIVYGTLDPALGALGITAFVVDRDTPGLTVGASLGTMGLRTSPLAGLVLDGCRVPAANRLGREGRGAAVFECAMEWERGAILANALGVMQRQVEVCSRRAHERKQSGRPLSGFQAVSHRLVEMQVRLEACRLFVYRVGALKDRGRDATREAAMAKLFVSQCFVQSSLDAIQIFGGAGYLTDTAIERDLRDAVGSLLYSGTSDIQRNIIARSLGL